MSETNHSKLAPRIQHPGDGFIKCEFCGREHWGLNGAAGILVARKVQSSRSSSNMSQRSDSDTEIIKNNISQTKNDDRIKVGTSTENYKSKNADSNEVTHLLLQLRAPWVTHGETWGIPGGALADGESDLEGALREAYEEAGIKPEQIRIVDQIIRDHKNWHFTTILALENPQDPITPVNLDHEALETRWIRLEELPNLKLMHHFDQEIKELTERLNTDAKYLDSI